MLLCLSLLLKSFLCVCVWHHHPNCDARSIIVAPSLDELIGDGPFLYNIDSDLCPMEDDIVISAPSLANNIKANSNGGGVELKKTRNALKHKRKCVEIVSLNYSSLVSHCEGILYFWNRVKKRKRRCISRVGWWRWPLIYCAQTAGWLLPWHLSVPWIIQSRSLKIMSKDLLLLFCSF